MKLKEILFWVWQLPQHLLGLALLHHYRDARLYHTENGRRYYTAWEMPSGISLGNYIILHNASMGNDKLHEYGHSRQSRMLGPLYLPVIGLPSIIGNLFDQAFHSHWTYERSARWYYSLPWEAWADKLGGVKRWRA